MDKLENSNNNQPPPNAVAASFEYVPYPASSDSGSNTPIGGECGTEDVDSNKSTPYFTPMDFLQTSFEFPSPTTTTSETTTQFQIENNSATAGTSALSNDALQNAQLDIVDLELYTVAPGCAQEQSEPGRSGAYSNKPFSVASSMQLLQRSPSFGRKFKRFSLYDRRSCSPQHLSSRSSSTAEDWVTPDTLKVIDNKENTVPTHSVCVEQYDEGSAYISHSGHNSPRILKDDGTHDGKRLSYSPKILKEDAAQDGSRLNYSPNLLASINNLNLSGSPLGIINSAGYKNGNFFRFPEIDHVVQDCTFVEAPVGSFDDTRYDNTARSRQKNLNAKIENTSSKLNTPGTQQKLRSSSASSDKSDSPKTPPITDGRRQENNQNTDKENVKGKAKRDSSKNRKNKNNLTIRITDTPTKVNEPQTSPLPKPKTPTIKEKARSLDSAANECEIPSMPQDRRESHASCDDMDSKVPEVSESGPQLGVAEVCLHPDVMRHSSNVYSTSLSQLDSHNAYVTTTMSGGCMPRRKSPGLNSTDWLVYHRKHNPYHVSQNVKYDSSSIAHSSVDSDMADYRSDSPQRSAFDFRSTPSNVESAKLATPMGATLAPRNMHKHNPMLHSSNNNLKTLPEFLTLVEFSTSNSPGPFKQKSMELPVSTHSNLPSMHPVKNHASTSSMNLLQRRGSNHSLTLNLHNSCGNLINSGLSVSNYSLGSVGNVNTILNSKSSCNLDTTSQAQPQQLGIQMGTNITQVSRQSLFRRRGSNHSIMLKGATANSCGDLNAVINQSQSLSGEKYRSICGGANSTSLTTSTASTSNVTSNAPTPKRGLLERRGSNQSFTLTMGGPISGSSSQQLCDTGAKDSEQKLKLQVCTCAAAQAAHHRKFFSTENLNSNRGAAHQYYDYNSKQLCFGSASDLKPSGYSVARDMSTAGPSDESTVCTCTGNVMIMTRPLSPQTTSEEFKIYLAGIQMLQSASNALNQYDLIKLNYVFDNSYKSSTRIIEQPPMLSNIRDVAETPTSSQLPITSEDCELLSLYQTVVQQILQPPLPQLDEEEQKRIFRGLHKEFWDLPLNHQEKPMVFGSQTKNRYKTILPNEHSRVILESETKELQKLEQAGVLDTVVAVASTSAAAAVADVDPKPYLVVADDAPYINANYIKGPDYVSKCYVATQGPMPNTIFDFWLMIYQNTQRYIRRSIDGGSSNSPHVDKELLLQQYYQKIVMLTNFTENSRQKCAIYFPVEVNEIFAVGAKQEVFQLSSELREYFSPYLNTANAHDTYNFGGSAELEKTIAIESTRVTLSADIRQALPAANNNFFLIRNVGIVRRNGYSIRKLVLLYCVCVPSQCANDDSPLVYHLQKLYCYHYWYPDWPDHRSPRDINTLLDTCLHVLNLGKCESEFHNFDEHTSCLPNAHLSAQRVQLYKQDIFNAVQPLPIIHCSAGIGRTGCFTAILNAVRQLRQSLAYSLTAMATSTPAATNELCGNLYDTDSSFTRNTLQHIAHILNSSSSSSSRLPPLPQSSATAVDEQDKEQHQMAVEKHSEITFGKLPKMPDIYVDILGIVCNLRLQRGGMVQNSEQYELIHRAICLYLKRTLALRQF